MFGIRIALSVSILGLVGSMAQADTPHAGTDAVTNADALLRPVTTEKNHDEYTVGIGVIAVPLYEGSSQTSVSPAAALRATIRGYDFSVSGTTVSLNLNRERPHKKRRFYYGPSVNVGFNSVGDLKSKDPQIAALNINRSSINIGGQFGYQKTKWLTPFDSASIGVGFGDNVSGTKNSYTISPNITYGTPVYRLIYVGLSASADYTGGGTARQFFAVTPNQSIASGLPAFDIGAGWRDVTVSGLVNIVLKGNLHHGLSLVVGASHETLLGAFAHSPIVRAKQQLISGAGLAYQF